MKENKYNINTLRMIRIVNNLNISQMSKLFEISNKHQTDVEDEKAKMNVTKLFCGLNNLKMTIEQYAELERFRIMLLEKNIEDKFRFKYMLLKTIGILSPKIKDQIDEMLNNALTIKTK